MGSFDVAVAHVAVAAGDHDGLCSPGSAALGPLTSGVAAEDPAEVGAPLLKTPPMGPSSMMSRADAIRGAADVGLPGRGASGRCRSLTQKAVRPGASPARGARRGSAPEPVARRGGDPRGVVVGLHEQVGGLGARVDAALGRPEPPRRVARHHRRVVLVDRQGVAGVEPVGVADVAEEAVGLVFAVQGPRGEDLVPAVLGVRLGEHHQLGVGGVLAQAVEGGHEVGHLVVGQGEAQPAVGRVQAAAPSARTGTSGGPDSAKRAAAAASGRTASVIRSCRAASTAPRAAPRGSDHAHSTPRSAPPHRSHTGGRCRWPSSSRG